MCSQCEQSREARLAALNAARATVQFNPEMLKQALGYILLNPESHDQTRWFRQNCQTTGCLAGWAMNFSGRTMLRSGPDTAEVEQVSIKDDDEVQKFTALGYHIHRNRLHFIPTREFLQDVAAYNSATDAEKRNMEKPQPNFDNHTETTVPFAVDIQVAATVDMGLSPRTARWLFQGDRDINEMIVGIGLLLKHDGSDDKLWGWIEGRLDPSYNAGIRRQIEQRIARAETSLSAMQKDSEFRLNILREHLNALKENVTSMENA